MRLLADDIVSFSIPLPFFTHLLISLSLKSKARRMREKERERERGLRGSKTSHRLRTPFSSIVPSSLVFQRSLVIFLLFVPGERRSLSTRERQISPFDPSFPRKEGREGWFSFFFLIFETFLSPLTILPSSSGRFVNPWCTCFEFYQPVTGRDSSRALK